MKVYLVGGAVRDSIMGREVHDRDYVVVGSTPEEMLSKGFKKVGADFPVFLDPEKGEEYALARTERKSGLGHKGFETDFDPRVTLLDDLWRRDFTMNAMAQEVLPDGSLGDVVDPFMGRDDIKDKRIRHISESFRDDPLRVLRAARFCATFGFGVHPSTVVLMIKTARSGELDSLTPERVWKETEKALAGPLPDEYFRALKTVGALERVFPEFHNLVGVEQPKEHHYDDAWDHSLEVLMKVSMRSKDTAVRWAALCHDLGKGTTPREEWPSHKAHDRRGVPVTEALCDRLKVPGRHAELAVLATQHHMRMHHVQQMRAKTLVKFFYTLDVFRRPERIEPLMAVCAADATCHRSFDGSDYQSETIFHNGLRAALGVGTDEIKDSGAEGKAFGDALRQKRVLATRRALGETEKSAEQNDQP